MNREDEGVLDALDGEGGLTTAFQPIVSVREQRVVGVEALARMRANGRTVSPADFIPVVAAAGRLEELIDAALRSFVSLRSAFDDDMYLAINVAGSQLREAPFIDRLAAAAEHHGIDPRQLVLELSETELVSADVEIMQALGRLRRSGMRIAADDVGTGYSNLSTLIAVRPDIIKIDQSIVVGLPHRPWDRVVAALVDVADCIRATVVAEGVERESQLLAIEELGVACAQGFLLGRPTQEPPARGWSWVGGDGWPTRAPQVGLVDDDERLGALVEDVFASDGYDVVVRETSSAAFLSRLCRTPVDIAIVDLVLGGREDALLSVVRPLRLLRPEVDVVVFSSLFDPATRDVAERLGAHWVEKADGPERLSEVCRQIVASSPRPFVLQRRPHGSEPLGAHR